MNIKRLYEIMVVVKNDFANNGLEDSIRVLLDAAKMTKNRMTVEHAIAAREDITMARNGVQSALDKCHEYSPAEIRVLKELGLEWILNTVIAISVRVAVKDGQEMATGPIEKLDTKIKRLRSYTANVLSSFNYFKISPQDLAKGGGEVGVIIPRVYVDNDLGQFSEELKRLNHYFGTFSEVATGNREGFQINYISSSELGIYIAMAGPVLFLYAKILEKLINSYKTLLDIRLSHKQLKEKGVSEENLEGIKKHVDQKIEETIKSLVKEVMIKYKLVKPRANELEIALTNALNGMANRIDSGFNFEIRVPTVEVSDTADVLGISKEQMSEIKSVARTLELLGETRESILKLPDWNDADDDNVEKPQEEDE